jgi:hypothetical protein
MSRCWRVAAAKGRMRGFLRARKPSTSVKSTSVPGVNASSTPPLYSSLAAVLSLALSRMCFSSRTSWEGRKGMEGGERGMVGAPFGDGALVFALSDLSERMQSETSKIVTRPRKVAGKSKLVLHP